MGDATHTKITRQVQANIGPQRVKYTGEKVGRFWRWLIGPCEQCARQQASKHK